VLVLLACACGRKPPPAGDDAQLAALDKQAAEVGGNGPVAGAALEKKGDLLTRMKRWKEAVDAYEAGAAAYERSPEGNAMPPLRAAACRDKAAQAKAQLR
jgi:hypothetical protein